MTFVRIEGKTQSYEWGKPGTTSKAAELATGLVPGPSKPYAELWMGTHPNGPSILADGSPLKTLLNNENLGVKIAREYAGDLPFLFKILSISKALSIQAHPDKILAQELHAKLPNLYKDPNHKPEMAIALTPFEAFIGFRPLSEIKNHLLTYPEFASVVGSDVVDAFCTQISDSITQEGIKANKALLRNVFGCLMNQDPDRIESALSDLFVRIKHLESPLHSLLLRLNSQFPGDVGIFCAFLLNLVNLKPGEAIFLAANEPHAYLSGDCIECMAASDNVVRSGLTPKFKDVETLVNMLTYNYGPADSQILMGEPYHSTHTRIYNPPIEEFSILLTTLDANSPKASLGGVNGPSIAIVTEGACTIIVDSVVHEAKFGYIFFIGANVPVEMKVIGPKCVIYRAFCD